MQNSVRKTFSLAIALLLALCGAAVAGDNANVVISLDGEHAAAGAGEQVQVAVSAAGMVGVNQFEITLTVLPADAFDLAATTFEPAFGFSPGVEPLGNGQVKSGAAATGESVDGDGALGVFTLTTSSSFSRNSPAEVVVSSVSIGSSSVDRDVLGAEGLFIVNWAPRRICWRLQSFPLTRPIPRLAPGRPQMAATARSSSRSITRMMVPRPRARPLLGTSLILALGRSICLASVRFPLACTYACGM